MTTLFHSARKLDAEGEAQDFWMLLREGRIAETGSGGRHPAADEVVDVGGDWLVPGFIDLHSHGGGGYSFDHDAEEIVRALATHRAHGTTRSVISLVTQPIAALRASLETVAELAAADPLVLGSHLEGPYLSDARRGAHHPEYLRQPKPFELEGLLRAAAGTLRQVTLAPEMPGGPEAIDQLVEAGVTVAIGHTEASYEQAAEAFERGARILTHAFNGMEGIHHRAPGPVVAAFDDERVTLELILDGLHVRPEVAAMLFRSAPGRIALITDAMAAAGASDGDYKIGPLNVSVRDGLARLTGTDSLAGSTLTQDVALRLAVERLQLEPRAAIAALTATPARALGLDDRLGRLAPGFAADAVILDREWHVQQVWGAGRRIR